MKFDREKVRQTINKQIQPNYWDLRMTDNYALITVHKDHYILMKEILQNLKLNFLKKTEDKQTVLLKLWLERE